MKLLAVTKAFMTRNRVDDSSSPASSLMHIRVLALRRRKSVKSTEALEEMIALPSGAPLSALWDKLRELGLMTSVKSKFNDFGEIEVIQDKPSEPGKSININDRLIAYANRHFGKMVELNIVETNSNDYGTQINSLKDNRGLEIMFHRTIRMPDDEKLHQLPGSLGAFPLYNVAGYSGALPDKIVQEGGVFLPMWQREALWMSLDASSGVDYALRFSVGRINAVSGLRMDEGPEVTAGMKGTQDYVVVPGQEWLDGICTAPGIVRQFVAMPLGSGYTIEGQKTGEEKYGGLQIEIIPSFQEGLQKWCKVSNTSPDPAELERCLRYNSLDEFKTAHELGLCIGDKIRLYPHPAFEYVACTLSDIVREDEPRGEVVLKSMYQFLPQLAKRRMQLAKSALFDKVYRKSPGDIWPNDSVGVCGELVSVGAQWEGGITAMPSLGRNSVLDDAATQEMLHSRGEEAETTRRIATKDLKAMGLAAGGKLIQDIYRDRNPARIWNVEAAKLVHVHILDPASFEAVTHTVPPPPPIDVMGYIGGGGSFFVVEEQPENRVDGGDFENVKSVSAMDKSKDVATEASFDPSQPTQCKCGIRLCDCVVRPCSHQFCNVCVREMDPSSMTGTTTNTSANTQGTREWFCPTCRAPVSYVAGFSAPMNLPDEESVKLRVPVNVLEVKDGRVAFKSVQQSRL